MSGSLSISGSTIQTGNNTLIGTTTLTGSIFMSGDIIPTASSSFDLGSLTNPWRAIYVQSGSISIQSDIPGGIPAVISNANGNITFAGAGFQLKSGSFVPFEVNSSARTVIRVPNIPANDIGGLSIIGSSDGSYQPVTNAGGLLHLTSNDEQSARLTVDAFGSGSFVSYVSRKARGTAASPLPVQAGDVMLRMATAGWTGTGYGISTPGVAAATTFEIVALDNFTTSSIGSRMHFYNAPSGSVTRTLSATIDTTGITIPTSSRFFGTASWAENALTASYVTTAQTASYVLNAISASYATTASYVKNAQTASYVNPLTQNVIITGSAVIGSSSLGASENTLTLGARDAESEGGQLGLNAPGGTYASASFIDNYANQFRILRGNNITSTGLVALWNLHTLQMQLPAYTGSGAFPGTEAAMLGVDTSGNVLTTSIIGSTIFGNYAGTGFTNPVVTYLPFGTTAVSAAEAQRQIASPFTGLLKNVYVRTNGAAAATSYTTFILRVNGVSTNIRINISGGQAAGLYSNILNSASVAVGDEISLQVSTSVANGPQVNQYSFGIYPS
jgi:hypothetical protein